MKKLLPGGRWRSFLPWIGIACLAIVQLWALPGDYLGQEHDDANYVLASRSLLRGEYRLGISPGNPPLTFIPPGWPILLMPAAAISGDNPAGYQLTAWLFLVICDVLTWLWLRRRLKPAQAFWAVTFFALNPLVLARAGKVMTEIPALALILALCVMLDWDQWPGWASGVMMGFLWLVRQRATALVAAVWAWYAIKRRWRDLAASAVVVTVAVAGWSWWLAHAGSGMPEFNELMAVYTHWSDIPAAVGSNGIGYLRLLGRVWLPYFPASAAIEATVGSLFFLMTSWGIWKIVRHRGLEPGIGWLLIGGAMHLFWPWQYERYLLPFLPMLLWGFLEGFESIPIMGNSWKNAILLAVIVGQFMGQGRYVLSGQFARSTPELRQTYAWIRQNIPEREALASLFFGRDALYTDHPFASLPKASSPGDFIRALRKEKVRYVLMESDVDIGLSLGEQAAPARELRILRENLRNLPFKRIYQNQEEKCAIYAL